MIFLGIASFCTLIEFINFLAFQESNLNVIVSKSGEVETCQTRTTTKKEKDAKFDLTLEFEHKASIESLRKSFLKIKMMPLKEHHGGEPLSVISIDYMALAFGPSHHAVRFKRNSGRSFLGLLQYNIQFEQVCNTKITVKKLDAKFNSIEEQPICNNFRIVTPDDKIESSWSGSKIAKYDTKMHQSKLHFNYLGRGAKAPTLEFYTTMEVLMASSIQI